MRLLRRILLALAGAVATAFILRSRGTDRFPSQSGGWRDLETE